MKASSPSESSEWYYKSNNEKNNYTRELIEDIGVIAGLVGVQFLYAGNSILLSHFLKLGFQPSSLIIFSSFATFLVLSPLSFFLERSQWHNRFSCRFLIQVLFLSFGGVTLFQSLYMKGVHLTSPTLATAMPNLAPGMIFFIAWACRLERVHLACFYTRSKIAGTLLCVSGAVLMSLMQSTHAVETSSSAADNHQLFDRGRMIGCIYLITAVLVLSSQVVLQAITLRDFPAPISLSAITSAVGMAMTTVVHMVGEQKWDLGWPSLTVPEMIAYAIVAGSIGGMCVGFNAWAMRKRGPVVVSIFNPLGTVVSAIFSATTLGEFIGVGSLTGMCLTFSGLYCVLWAKGKEGLPSIHEDGHDRHDNDMEKCLLT